MCDTAAHAITQEEFFDYQDNDHHAHVDAAWRHLLETDHAAHVDAYYDWGDIPF